LCLSETSPLVYVNIRLIRDPPTFPVFVVIRSSKILEVDYLRPSVGPGRFLGSTLLDIVCFARTVGFITSSFSHCLYHWLFILCQWSVLCIDINIRYYLAYITDVFLCCVVLQLASDKPGKNFVPSLLRN